MSAPGPATEILEWLVERLPGDWFDDAPSVRADREEILVVGHLATPAMEDGCSEHQQTVTVHSAIEAFRETTRDTRVAIAKEAESRWRRTVSWGVTCCDVSVHFTTAAVPVMTRLRMDERAVLDVLIDAGIARSRSEAVAWCVRLVAHHEGEWIDELRDALTHVEEVRRRGPAGR
ncbi:MAG: hypothetical protein S0880_04495 [Actinomycetota bacterium]|nr:hypothetical protein [Actinomycetota bacterium]